MSLIKKILSTGILFLYSSIVTAQSGNATIKGVVQDNDSFPVPFATVALLTSDSALVKGEITQNDGSYIFSSVKPDSYRIQIQNIEYETYLSSIFSVAGGEEKQIPKIKMIKSVIQLDEMVVTASKQLVEVHPDKMVFNVSSSANASGNNGLELLSKAPGVLVDPDNNIILQGKSGVRIFINGRPSRLSGTDLVTMLQSMQSDNIESIEIITNPSARFEAEGNAGIINIKLKKNVNLGYNGSIISNISKGDYWRNSNGLSLNYRSKKINLSGNITQFNNDFQSDYVDIKQQSGFNLDQSAIGLNHQDGYNFSAGIDYAFNNKHSLSLNGRGILTNSLDKVNSDTRIIDAGSNNLIETLLSSSKEVYAPKNYNYNLNYLYIPSKSTTLSSDISLGSYKNFQATEQPNQYIETDGVTVNRVVNNEFNANTNIGLFSVKLDFEKRFDKLNLSAGGKYSYINTDNLFDFYNVKAGISELDINKSNDFAYTERVSALYLIVSNSLSKNIRLNAGLRMEYTSSEGSLKSQIVVDNTDVVRDYINLFPNVGLSFQLKREMELSLGVGRRITRPNYQDLNPFEEKLSELVFFKGNPFLRPNYVMNYQTTFSYKKKLVISNVYSKTSDFFANILKIVDEKGTFLIPQNLQSVINNGLSVSYPFTFTKWWEASSFINYNYSAFSGDVEGALIDLQVHIYNFRIQNNFTLPGKLAIDATYYYNSPFVWRGSIKIERTSGVNLGIKKDFFANRLQLRLTATDIFNNSSDYVYNGNYGGLVINGIRSIDRKRYGAGLTYKFGNQKIRATRKKSALDDELDRISN